MKAYDDSGNLITSAKGNWLYLGAGKPIQFREKTLTLRPTRERYGLEIAGKFPWHRDAWLAGEGSLPSLTPGTYTVRAEIVNGKSRAIVYEWKIDNPGAAKPLEVIGTDLSKGRTRVGIRTEPPTSLPPASVPLNRASRERILSEALSDAAALRNPATTIEEVNEWLDAIRVQFDVVALSGCIASRSASTEVLQPKR